jgi:hypothetical protein
MILSTTRLTRARLGSGPDRRSSRNASARATRARSSGAARSPATSRSPAAPKTSATATRRSVSVDTGAPRVTAAYQGDLEGKGTAGLLLLYDGSDAGYGGYERVTGTLSGRSGSFVVLCLDGGFEQGTARTTWTVEEQTGTGELTGLRGAGGYVAAQGEAEVAFELRWSLPASPG